MHPGSIRKHLLCCGTGLLGRFPRAAFVLDHEEFDRPACGADLGCDHRGVDGLASETDDHCTCDIGVLPEPGQGGLVHGYLEGPPAAVAVPDGDHPGNVLLDETGHPVRAGHGRDDHHVVPDPDGPVRADKPLECRPCHDPASSMARLCVCTQVPCLM